MKLGDRVLSKSCSGVDVIELQLKLSGFRGTIWDGNFGPGTELQVAIFQKEYMQKSPDGIVTPTVVNALEKFSAEHPIDFNKLKCKCGQCDGFGKEQYKGVYLNGIINEAYHKYEYPGIHKAILHAFKATAFYVKKIYGYPVITCGYRCWIRNAQKGRITTNHMGKALDIDFILRSDEDKSDDYRNCNAVRGLITEKSYFQTGWSASNRKALEPSNISPTWIHMDIRSYETRYLEDTFFVKTEQALNTSHGI